MPNSPEWNEDFSPERKVYRFSFRLDERRLQKYWRDAIHDDPTGEYRLNCAEDDDDISSAELGRLVVARKILEIKGGQLILCGVGPKLREMLKATGVDRLFKIQDDDDVNDDDGNGASIRTGFPKPPGSGSTALELPKDES